VEQLTQEEAERYARACEWRLECLGHHDEILRWYSPTGESYTVCWGAYSIIKPDQLPLDPRFWRPRLEDRLIELDITIESALCEAIEKLTEVQIESKSGQEKGKP